MSNSATILSANVRGDEMAPLGDLRSIIQCQQKLDYDMVLGPPAMAALSTAIAT
jgi:hypothetical protein